MRRVHTTGSDVKLHILVMQVIHVIAVMDVVRVLCRRVDTTISNASNASNVMQQPAVKQRHRCHSVCMIRLSDM